MNTFQFNRGTAENPGNCQRVIEPKCEESTEDLILNEFGHPVCFCKTNEKFYPLLPSLRYRKDEKNLEKCIHYQNSNICENGEALAVNEDGVLACSNKDSKIVGLSAFAGIEFACKPNHIERFGTCIPIRGR